MEKEDKNEETMFKVANKFVKEIKPLDSDISKWIDENFWDLK